MILLDAILSTEILLVANGMLTGKPALLQAATLGIVSAATTLGVYGTVLGIIRADNIATSLCNPKNKLYFPKAGKALMRGLPHALKAIGAIGTIAMLGVGGEVLSHIIPPAMQGIGAAGLGETIHHATTGFTNTLSAIPMGASLATAAIGLGAGLIMTTAATLVKATTPRIKPKTSEPAKETPKTITLQHDKKPPQTHQHNTDQEKYTIHIMH